MVTPWLNEDAEQGKETGVKPANSVLTSYGTTIFEVMSRLAADHGAVNLGQGFPEGLEPPALIAAAARAVTAGPHQYPSMMGIPALRQAVADHAKRFYGLEVDPLREVMVTSGATEALADCLFGLIEPGDEVVLIEPLYDSYLPIVRRAGGVPKLVRLEPPNWDLPRADLAAAFGPRTKLLIMNSPMNPTGKVFNRDELTFIADLLIKHDAYAVCDEVYEHLIYDGKRHIPLITLPGMRDRAIRIGSAGKTFSLTELEDRLCHRRAEPAAAGGQGAPVHHLHHADQPAAGGGRGIGQRRPLLHQPRRRAGRPARPAGRGAALDRLRRAALQRQLLPDRRHPLGRVQRHG